MGFFVVMTDLFLGLLTLWCWLFGVVFVGAGAGVSDVGRDYARAFSVSSYPLLSVGSPFCDIQSLHPY